ncbi:MAG: enoyl-CoA hydratase/isomerase family protein [Burkholderiales bacterium]|nr:enoyl-CoA hydratase/isomerase family protein [Burkholderiales bacterium]
MTPIRYDTDAEGIVTLTFDAPGAAVNTMTAACLAAMTESIDRIIAAGDQVAGVILASAKKTFFAGAELKDVLRLTEAEAPRWFAEIEKMKKDWRRLETCGKPVVAALAGTALGGGWELALTAHHRVAVDDARIQLGLPEVTLGLLPGAGGVTKMVRLLGLQAAFPYLMEGKTMTPRQASELGLVHELAETADDMLARARAWIRAHPQARQPWDEKGYRIPGGGPDSPKIAQTLAIAPAITVEKTRGLLPAPEAIMACAVEGARVDFDTALRLESRYLVKLAVGRVAKNLISLFFNQTAIRSGASRPKDVPKWKPSRVGILGAGMMGSGIAWANASRGIACVLKDLTQEAADKGKAYTARLLDKRVQQGRMDEVRAGHTLSLITPTANTADLAGCDLIIEAVFEKRDLKAQVTREAEPLLAEGGFFASNTSTLPISGLAEAAARPEKFIGLHIFSPVDKMALVEIIKGRKTDAETLARAYDYVLAIGKTPIVVNDARGFYTSRTFGTFVREGACMVEEGIPAAVIENAARAAGMPVGPLAVIDETSMSLSVHVTSQTRADFAAEGKTYVAQPGEGLFERMVNEFKRPGRAGGGGFYDYPAGARKTLWAGLKQFEKPGATWDLEELKDRFLYRQAIETARCLEEGVLMTAHDANIGSIFGIGFPAWTGGALRYIDSEGVASFVAKADRLAAKYGERFAVPALLRAKAARGESVA